MLFISKWGRISPESDWCWLKILLGSFSLLLRGYTDLSLAVGHVSECPHSGTRYFNLRDHSSITSAGLSTILAMLLLEENENKVFIEH